MNEKHEMNMGEILEKVDEILLFHLMLNGDAMKAAHALGYNGFKRMHRCNEKYFNGLHLAIENEATDDFRMMLDSDVDFAKYKPSDLKDHLVKWDSVLAKDITELGMLNNAFRMHRGQGLRVIKKALCRMKKNYEKTGRWIKRFNESGWAPHDMHTIDDKIHADWKCREKNGKY
jgi:hypothetical protein